MPTYSVADIADPAKPQTYSVEDIAPPGPSASLPDPQTADQMTTFHARQIAEIATRPPGYTPPPIAPAPLPEGLKSDQQRIAEAPTRINAKTGEAEKILPPGLSTGLLGLLDSPVTGGRKIGEGVEQMAQPGARQKFGGAHKVVSGAFEAATPLMAASGVTAPLKTAVSVGAGMISQAAVEKGLTALGLPKEYAAVAGDLTGIFAGIGAHKLSGKAATAIKSKYEPILKARAAKTGAPEASANSTGTQTYRPEDIADENAKEPPARPDAAAGAQLPLQQSGGAAEPRQGEPAGQTKEVAQPSQPAHTAQPAQAKEADNSGEYFRGDWNVPLNDAGRAQVRDRAAATAGQFDRIVTGTKDRHTESARIYGDANPQARETHGNPAFDPMHMGQHEGEQVTPERLAQVNDHIANRFDEPIPGVGKFSGSPGESPGEWSRRLIGAVQDEIAKWKPGQKTLIVTSGRDVQAIRAWAAKGMPADRSIDASVLTQPWKTQPGEMARLDPRTGEIENVTSADKPGIYAGRHGETDANANAAVPADVRNAAAAPPAAGGEPESGPHGPIYREYSGRPAEAIAKLLREQKGEVPRVWHHPELGWIDLIWGNERGGLAHIVAKHVEGQRDLRLDDLADLIPGMRIVNNDGRTARLESDSHEAGVRLDYDGNTKRWLVTAYEKPSTGGSPLVPGSPQSAPQGDGHTPSDGSASSVETKAPEDKAAGTADRGPAYMASGFGALEPLFREAKAEGDRLRAARNDALAAAKAAQAKPEQMKAGEKIRAYFTAERDLWAARSNQAIDRVSRLVLPKIRDREALGIAREFRHKPEELQEFIDGTHPFLEEVDGGPKEWEKNLNKIMPLLRQAQRILAKPTARERAADAAFTNIAQRDLDEGRKGGWFDSRWRSDEYVYHALNPAGEGAVAKPPSTAVRQMGRIGKFFGPGLRRSDRYPTLVHAVADGIIPKTLDPSALFIVHADQFARARATHLLEAELAADNRLGRWGDGKSTPRGWVQLAGHTDEFKKEFAYKAPDSHDPETGEDELRTGRIGLYVPPFIDKALGAITDPDYTAKIPGFAKLRTAQRGLKEAILGWSGFHLLTENYMAAGDIGPAGMLKAFRTPRESPETLANERDLIASGGTTSIQGSTMDAYRGLRPGTIPTRAEVVKAYIFLGPKQPPMQIADAITRFTFDNVQRRFKVWSFALHRDAWIHDNPHATPEQLAEAKKGIASYVNGVYGGLHWENIGIARGTVEILRAAFLAPDWSGSNIALAKYAADARLSPHEIPFRDRMAGADTKESAQARLARAFWAKQLLGGLVATQMLSLLLSRQLSHHPFQVYEGKDKDGKDVYQNVFFRGSMGDAVNLWGKGREHGGAGYRADGIAGLFTGILLGAGVFVQGKLAPVTKLGMHVLTTRDDHGKPITPGGLAGDVLPIPILGRTVQKTFFGDESDKYLWSERMLSLFGPLAQHVGDEDSERRDRRREARARRFADR